MNASTFIQKQLELVEIEKNAEVDESRYLLKSLNQAINSIYFHSKIVIKLMQLVTFTDKGSVSFKTQNRSQVHRFVWPNDCCIRLGRAW